MRKYANELRASIYLCHYDSIQLYAVMANTMHIVYFTLPLCLVQSHLGPIQHTHARTHKERNRNAHALAGVVSNYFVSNLLH